MSSTLNGIEKSYRKIAYFYVITPRCSCFVEYDVRLTGVLCKCAIYAIHRNASLKRY